ncbi:hypothetical protein HIM_00365 [Hirsutella minnesotensis 3608]|nr:hypothetical protein HIM_00365 [Hirsutella minnesotensis 3608]
MASEALFREIPAFPEDVPLMEMKTVSLASLHAGDSEAVERMFEACKELGFFLLDLHGDDLGDKMVEEIDRLFGVGKDIMDLPPEVKQPCLHDIPKSFLGFKPFGHSSTETNQPDRFEWFNLGQDGLLGTKPLQPLPDLVKDHLALFTSFLNHSQDIVATINHTLATQLGLPEDAFSSLQTPTEPSGTAIRLIKAYACEQDEDLRTTMVHHTDFGTITLLANVVGGLQILTPGMSPADEDAWRWARPQPRCLIVNLGDAMVQWTGGILRSNIHRIRYPPGQQRYMDRYSLGLLVRPKREASMRPLITEKGKEMETESVDMTAWEWEVKKMMALANEKALAAKSGGKPIAA